ncbi:uncharacterized protein LOC135491641 [Lineus longissimus]|uniref:uncharacterized protein LOC135491641 n=1 Tax=Lineus longissimus TaxID=88925 RepID=UPI00315CFDCC
MLSKNDDKIEVMLFASPHNLKALDHIAIQVGDCLVRSSPDVRNFGVIFDTKMNMEKQVTSVCKSAYAQLRNIGHIWRYLTNRAARSLATGLVISRLDYCNSFLGWLPKVLTKWLQRVQNTAARIVTGTPRHEHISPVLKQLHWLPVGKRIQFKTLVLAFRCLHGQAPRYLSDMINVDKPQRLLRSENSFTLVIPGARTQDDERRFSVFTAKLWNQLPEGLQKAPSLNIFKKMLKTHLFNKCLL